MEHRELPNTILETIVKKNTSLNLENLELVKASIGAFTGEIMPYIYEVTLSTTNSRRSRAGTTFEHIITYIMGYFEYPYVEQASLGTAFYKTNDLGKLVDGILPSAKAYQSHRSMCVVISMKTTIRERW